MKITRRRLIKENRKRKIKEKRNFFPSLVMTAFFWISLALIVVFVNPSTFGIIPLFLVFIFFASLFAISLLLNNTKRGVLAATAVTFFLVLRLFGVGNLLNIILLAGIVIAIEYYTASS